MTPLVIGIGNPWRRDDGVGPCAVAALSTKLPAGVDTATLDGEPTKLLDAWADRPFVLVIDAVYTGAPAGTIHRLDALESEVAFLPAASSHGPGIAEAIALGRALGRLPDRLIVLGVEPADTGHGDHFSGPVLATFDMLVRNALEEVRTHVPE